MKWIFENIYFHTSLLYRKKAVDLGSVILNATKSLPDSVETFSWCFAALYPGLQSLTGPSGPNITCWFRTCSGVETKLHSRHGLINYLSTLTWQTSTASSPLELYYWPSSSVSHWLIIFTSIRNHSNKNDLNFCFTLYKALTQCQNITGMLL